MTHAGQIVHRATLANAAGHTDQPDHPHLDRLIHRLRRRTQPSPLSPTRLHPTETGYLLSSTPGRTTADKPLHRYLAAGVTFGRTGPDRPPATSPSADPHACAGGWVPRPRPAPTTPPASRVRFRRRVLRAARSQ